MNIIYRRRWSPSDALREAPPGPGESIRRSMPDTDEGIRRLEIPKMVQYVREYNSDPDIVKAARTIVSLCEAKDKRCEMASIFEWMKNHFRYVNDPVNKEVLATPRYHLAEVMTPPQVLHAILGDDLLRQMRSIGAGRSFVGSDPRKSILVCRGCFEERLSGVYHSKTHGDCDEGATFAATMLAAVGIVPRFRLGGRESDQAPDGCSYYHVWVQGLDDDGHWIDFDVTEKRSKLGWFHDGFECTGVVSIFPDAE